jgi:hypothetical protein
VTRRSRYKTRASAIREANAGDGRVDVALVDGSGTVRVERYYVGLDLRGRTVEGVEYRLTLAGAELIA